MKYRFIILGVILLIIGGCSLRSLRMGGIQPPRKAPDQTVIMEVTGYCACGKCCGWKRNWHGKPVIASGPDKGKAKRVGITASGSRARFGTIAADTAIYPYGTVMYVPGYGYGRVEDRGGAIKGRKIDLFFGNHTDALRWGRNRLKVKVWYPRG